MDIITDSLHSPALSLSQDEALCHLFFHCCLEDDNFTSAEIDDLSGKLVTLGLNSKIKVREELVRYRSYKPAISDEREYIKELIHAINPANELALYSYCVELCIDDPVLDAREEALLVKIRAEMGISPDTADLINRLMAQRKVAEIQKLF